MLKKRPKFSHGYKRYNLPQSYKHQVKYGDYAKISRINNIDLSSISYAFSSGWATFEIINAIKKFYDEKELLQ